MELFQLVLIQLYFQQQVLAQFSKQALIMGSSKELFDQRRQVVLAYFQNRHILICLPSQHDRKNVQQQVEYLCHEILLSACRYLKFQQLRTREPAPA